MKVKFHVLQRDDESGKTRHKFLFTDERSILMTGIPVTHAGTIYQVNSLEWIDQVAGVLKAVCLEVPGPNTQFTE